MNIAIGSDHAGYKLKNFITAYLVKNKNIVFDVGTFTEESCDYPEFAKKAARLILSKKAKSGVLICKSGIGMTMAANRHKGIRAALCRDIKSARLSREHNNANILVLGSAFTKKEPAKKICGIFLKTKFAEGRHLRRIRSLDR
ncbi:MAG: ribose 5-phosphate isomerase B [Candidatus Omnitrophica bacterium]|nr:ribose 5-phosphate isomerase B [Candidatus Omnitrophota bacterium]